MKTAPGLFAIGIMLHSTAVTATAINPCHDSPAMKPLLTASAALIRLLTTLLLAMLVQPAGADGLFQGLTSVDAGPRLDDDGVIRQQVEQNEMHLEAGSGARIQLPTQCVSSALVARSHTRLNALFPEAGGVTQAGLIADDGSRMLGSGTVTNEAGLTVERLFGAASNPYRLETAFNAHRIDLYNYELSHQQTFGSAFDTPVTVSEQQGFNVNTRLSRSFGDLDLALRVENLFPNRQPGMVASPYTMKAHAELGTDFHYAGMPTRLDLNLDRFEALQQNLDARYAGARLQWGAADRTRLRLGYRHDLIANLDSVATLGLAFPLFHVFDLDISGTKNPGNAYGVLARLAAPF